MGGGLSTQYGSEAKPKGATRDSWRPLAESTECSRRNRCSAFVPPMAVNCCPIAARAKGLDSDDWWGALPRLAFVADTLAHLSLYERVAAELHGECEVLLYRWTELGEAPPFDRSERQMPCEHSKIKKMFRSAMGALKKSFQKFPKFLRDGLRRLAVAGILQVYILRILPQILCRSVQRETNFRVAVLSSLVQHASKAAMSGKKNGNARASCFVIANKMLQHVPLWSDVYRSNLLAKEIVDSQVSLIVFPEDNIISGTALLVCQALASHNADVQTVAVQYTMGVEAEWRQAFHARSASSRVQRLRARIVRQTWPHMHGEADGVPYAFPISVCARIEAMRVRPVAPWSGYGGNVDVHIVDTEREFCVAQSSVPPSVRVMQAEAVEVSQVKRLRRERFRECPQDSITICLPPNHFQSDLIAGSIQAYDAFLVQLIGRMRECELHGHRLSFCAHPRLIYEPAFELLGSHSIHIEPDLSSALSKSFLLITFGSAVRRFAPELSIASIDWDVFGFRSGEGWVSNGPELEQNAVLATTFEEFDGALRRLLSAPAHDIVRHQQIVEHPRVGDALRGLLGKRMRLASRTSGGKCDDASPTEE